MMVGNCVHGFQCHNPQQLDILTKSTATIHLDTYLTAGPFMTPSGMLSQTPAHGHRQQPLQHMPFNSAHKITGTKVHKSTLPEAHATSLVRIFQQNCKYLAYQIWVALYMILNSSEAWVPYYAAGITCINTIASTCSAGYAYSGTVDFHLHWDENLFTPLYHMI